MKDCLSFNLPLSFYVWVNLWFYDYNYRILFNFSGERMWASYKRRWLPRYKPMRGNLSSLLPGVGEIHAYCRPAGGGVPFNECVCSMQKGASCNVTRPPQCPRPWPPPSSGDSNVNGSLIVNWCQLIHIICMWNILVYSNKNKKKRSCNNKWMIMIFDRLKDENLTDWSAEYKFLCRSIFGFGLVLTQNWMSWTFFSS